MNLSKMKGFRMNRRSSGSLFLSKAIGGFIQYKAAEGLSPTTLRSYEDHLKLWVEHLGDKPVNWIKTADVQEYFVWLRTEYEPRRFGGDRRALSAKTVRNFYISLCAFFTWASREFDLPSPMKAVPSPKFEEPPIEPFTKEEVEALLKAGETIPDAFDARHFHGQRRTVRDADVQVQLSGVDRGIGRQHRHIEQHIVVVVMAGGILGQYQIGVRIRGVVIATLGGVDVVDCRQRDDDGCNRRRRKADRR